MPCQHVNTHTHIICCTLCVLYSIYQISASVADAHLTTLVPYESYGLSFVHTCASSYSFLRLSYVFTSSYIGKYDKVKSLYLPHIWKWRVIILPLLFLKNSLLYIDWRPLFEIGDEMISAYIGLITRPSTSLFVLLNSVYLLSQMELWRWWEVRDDKTSFSTCLLYTSRCV